MNMLITGGSGALGSGLQAFFSNAHAPGSSELDVCNADQVKQTLEKLQPDVIVHAAAMVGVRECEENKENAWKTNVEGTQNIVQAAQQLESKPLLIYISTACVFPGEPEKYYTEEDTPSPKNYYSLTKLCGEMVTRQYPNTCIVRTNFAPKQPWKYPKAFSDRFGTYLFPEQIAQGIKDIVEKNQTGIVHVVGDKRMSMFDLAKAAGTENIEPMTIDEYDGPPVTMDMSLSTSHWKKYTLE